jgi:putative ABC transport system permease protein
MNRVKNTEGIETIAGSISRQMVLPLNFYGRDSTVTGLTLVGVDPVAAPTLRDYPVAQGRFLKQGDGNDAVITSSLADSIGLKLGDTLRLPTTEGVAKLTIVGLRPGRPSFGNEEVLIPLSQAQKLLDRPGLVNVIEANMATKDPAARQAIAQQIQTQLGRNYKLNALTDESQIFGILQTSQATFNILGILTLFMGGFIIFNTFRTIVAERRHDIGMLRAIGASRATIVGTILTEGIAQGVVGTAIGLALGISWGWLLQSEHQMSCEASSVDCKWALPSSSQVDCHVNRVGYWSHAFAGCCRQSALGVSRRSKRSAHHLAKQYSASAASLRLSVQ